MVIARLMGLFTIIPATVLLTISFFVLCTLRRTDAQGLKAFGYVTAALLWVSALLVFSAGIYTLSTGKHPMACMIRQMRKPHMQEMMKEGQRPGMMHKNMGEPITER